jgi:broad specificity phosphatase PhoE
MASTPANTFVIFTVRHGTSCANVLKEEGKWFKQTRFHDPGLTRNGIIHAIQRGKLFREKLATEYGSPSVYASVLLRAQMTAYLMMNPDREKPFTIGIRPYLSEEGAGEFARIDNEPLDFNAQKKILDRINECKHIKRIGYTSYTGDQQSDKIKPNINLFKKELQKLCHAIKKKGSSYYVRSNVNQPVQCNIVRKDPRTAYSPLVIVTHGHTIEKLFKSIGAPITREDRPNFTAFRLYFNMDTGEFIQEPAGTSYVYPYGLPPHKLDLAEECKEEKINPACQSPVCVKGGRRTRKIRRRHTRR